MLDIEVFAERTFIRRGIDLYFRDRQRGLDGDSILVQATFEDREPAAGYSVHGNPPQPITLGEEQAQDLFDQLYSMGFRPSRSSGDYRAIEGAHKSHIASLNEELGGLHKIINKILDK